MRAHAKHNEGSPASFGLENHVDRGDNHPRLDPGPAVESIHTSHGQTHADALKNYRGPRHCEVILHLPDRPPILGRLAAGDVHLAGCGMMEIRPETPDVLLNFSNRPPKERPDAEILDHAYTLALQAQAVSEKDAELVRYHLEAGRTLDQILHFFAFPSLFTTVERAVLGPVVDKLREAMRETYEMVYPPLFVALPPSDLYPPLQERRKKSSQSREDDEREPLDYRARVFAQRTGITVHVCDSEAGLRDDEKDPPKNMSTHLLAEAITHGYAATHATLPHEISPSVYQYAQFLDAGSLRDILTSSLIVLDFELQRIITSVTSGKSPTFAPNVLLGSHGMPDAGKTTGTNSIIDTLKELQRDHHSNNYPSIHGITLDISGPSRFSFIRNLSPEFRLLSEQMHKQRVFGPGIPQYYALAFYRWTVDSELWDRREYPPWVFSCPYFQMTATQSLNTIIDEMNGDHSQILLSDNPPVGLLERDLAGRQNGPDHLSAPPLIMIGNGVSIGMLPPSIEKQVLALMPESCWSVYHVPEGTGGEFFASRENPKRDPTFFRFYQYILTTIETMAHERGQRCTQVVQDMVRHWRHHEDDLHAVGIDPRIISRLLEKCRILEDPKIADTWSLEVDPTFIDWIQEARHFVHTPPKVKIDTAVERELGSEGIHSLVDIVPYRNGITASITELDDLIRKKSREYRSRPDIARARTARDNGKPELALAMRSQGIDIDHPERSVEIVKLETQYNQMIEYLVLFDYVAADTLRSISGGTRSGISDIIVSEMKRLEKVIHIQTTPSPRILSEIESLRQLLELIFSYNPGLQTVCAGLSGYTETIPLHTIQHLTGIKDINDLRTAAALVRGATSMSVMLDVRNRFPQVWKLILERVPPGEDVII